MLIHRLTAPLVLAVVVVLTLALIAAILWHVGPFHANAFYVKRGVPQAFFVKRGVPVH